MRSGRAVRRLATVLFTDIVGSTPIAAALGDERWRRLLNRHHAIVRRELRRFGGREIDTAGDGFFSVFEQPAGALRCALAIGNAVRDIGLEIRAGVHTGEVETMGGSIGGLAVHIAARVISLAEPREILASTTVRDLTAGSGFEFEDRGVHDLKGVPGTWPVVAVVALAGARPPAPLSASEAEAARARASLEPPRGRGGRRRRPLIAASAAVGAAVIVVIVLVLARPNRDDASPPPAIPPGGLLLEIDPETNSIAGQLPLPGPRPLVNGAQIAVGQGGVWAIRPASPEPPGTDVIHLDPETGRVEATIRSPEPLRTREIVVGARSVWVLGQFGLAGGVTAVDQMDPADDDIVGRVEVTGEPGGIAAAEDAAWVVTTDGELSRLDPHRIAVVDSATVGSSATGLEVGAGALWVLDDFEGVLFKVDPETLDVAERIDVQGSPKGMAVGGGRVWVFDEVNGTVTPYDARTGDAGAALSGEIEQPTDIAYAFGAVWVTDTAARSVVRIDAGTGAADAIPLAIAPGAIAPDPERGTLWVWGR